ncbi:MAG: HAMP domain-containing histidine kinase [Chloroflexi bacterium]|nr:HAMP domain-containing histidine kinase [Chloroflexota bacterium]
MSPSPQELQAQLDEQTRVNERLREATEHFVTSVAHDVKNPLAAIKVNVQGLKRRLERGEQLEPEVLTERLARVEHSVQHVLDLLATARAKVASTPTEARPPLRPEPTDLVSLTKELAAACRTASRRTIQIEAAQPVLVGSWDPDCLRRTIEELLANAVKFSADNGDVIVSLERDGGAAVLCVRDHGIGIPERDLPHVFDRFHRGENVLGRFPGSGLGLFQVRQDVERQGGEVSAGNAPDRGCVITVRLPIGAL